MKKVVFLLFLLPSLCFAQSRNFVITGKVSGVADGEVKLTTTQNGSEVLLSGEIKNGAFSLKGTLDEPGLYWLVISDEQPVYIYLENSDITVTGTKNEIKKLNIEGSSAHNDFAVFQTIFNPLIGELNAIAAQLQQARNEKKENTFLAQYDSVVKVINKEVGSFVTSKKNSYVAAFVLYITAQLSNSPSVLEGYYNLLSEPVRHSQIGKNIAEYIAYSKAGSIGSDAIDFTQNDVDGNPVTLSSFKGKYVLVDFWASWCGPCRQENPNVVKAYNKFKDKNFTIIGVSLDDNKAAWTKAIQKDKLAWTHVSDLQQWRNAVAQLYRVQSIPQNFLVDPNGKIIARDLRGRELEAKLTELLESK